jgi:NAD(P)-dependent dehydrogenase (short-subunit alcohol dehydrogenase family)
MKELHGKVAVVTGAASGIGRAMAGRFVAEGMKLVVADVEHNALELAAAELRAAGGQVTAVQTNVARADEVEKLAHETFDSFGAAHVLCNNAGVYLRARAWEYSLADWEWVLGVDLFGVIHGIRSFVPRMLAQDTECHIVNTASVAGLVALPAMAAYTVAKHGVAALSETLRDDLQDRGARIGVSVLCPGGVQTQIASSERNRLPEFQRSTEDVAGAPDVAHELPAAVESALARNIVPTEVADHVVAAIREDRFYVLTHTEFRDGVRRRMEGIINERQLADLVQHGR